LVRQLVKGELPPPLIAQARRCNQR
jgi:hypothetical protein